MKKNKKIIASLATATLLANSLSSFAVVADQVTPAPSTDVSTAQETPSSTSTTTTSASENSQSTQDSQETQSSSSETAISSTSSADNQEDTSGNKDESNTTTAQPEQPTQPSQPADSAEPAQPTTPAEDVMNTFTVNFVDTANNQPVGQAVTQSTTQDYSDFTLPAGYVTLGDAANGIEAGKTSIRLTSQKAILTVYIQKAASTNPSQPTPPSSTQPSQPAPSKPKPKPLLPKPLPPKPSTPAQSTPTQPSQTAPASQPAQATQPTQTAPVTPAPAAPTIDLPSPIGSLEYHYDYNNDTAKFIASIAEQSRIIAKDNNLYASVMIAQAVLESGSGASKLAQGPNYNLFGIKGSFNKKSVSFLTMEDNGFGGMFTIKADFKRYDNTSESLLDYANLLKNGLDGNHDFYAAAWKSNAKTYEQATLALQGKYATDTQYAAKLNGLIKKYDLTKYDQNTAYATTQYSVNNAENQNVFDGQAGKIDKFTDSNFTGQKVAGQTIDAQNDTIVRLLSTATSQLGVPYVWGGATFATDKTQGALDCSGLVQQTYLKALGIQLPRTSQEQSLLGTSVPVDVKDLQPGDLLFVGDAGKAHHVVMYLTNGYFIEAPLPGKTVQIGNIKDEHFDFAKRIIPSSKKTTIDLKAEVNYQKNAVTERKAGNLSYGNDQYYQAKTDGNFELLPKPATTQNQQ